jgi:predicted nuclease with TOPRIM domain
MAEELQHKLDQTRSDLDEANKRVSSLDQENFTLRQQLDDATARTIQELSDDLAASKRKVVNLEQENFGLRQQVLPAAVKEELADAKKKISVLEGEFAAIKAKKEGK